MHYQTEKIMRRKLLSLIALTFVAICVTPLVARAQYKYTFRDSLGVYKVEFTPYANPREEARIMGRPVAAGQHEIRLGLGVVSDTSVGYTTATDWTPANDLVYRAGGAYNDSDNIYPGSTNWITLGFEGGRWFKDWLYFGGTFVWTGGYDRLLHKATHKLVYSYQSHNFTLMPTLRFAWYRRGIVQLYSGLGVGVVVSHTNNVYSDNTRLTASYDVTFFGVSVGRNLFGYFDLGAGMRGVFSFGLGYRFNKK